MALINVPCPSCQTVGGKLTLNYYADRTRFPDAPGRWWVDCQTCWDQVKNVEPEPDYHLQAHDFMTANAATELDNHLRGKLWYTETVQARMRATVSDVLPLPERVKLNAAIWPIPFGRDAAIEMRARFHEVRKAAQEPRIFDAKTFAELNDEASEMRTRIEDLEEGVFPEHGRMFNRLWNVAPQWLRAQLQKLDDRGIEAILRAFAQRNEDIS